MINIKHLLAKIFGRKVVGIDYVYGNDKTVETHGHILKGVLYIDKVKIK